MNGQTGDVGRLPTCSAVLQIEKLEVFRVFAHSHVPKQLHRGRCPETFV